MQLVSSDTYSRVVLNGLDFNGITPLSSLQSTLMSKPGSATPVLHHVQAVLVPLIKTVLNVQRAL